MFTAFQKNVGGLPHVIFFGKSRKPDPKKEVDMSRRSFIVFKKIYVYYVTRILLNLHTLESDFRSGPVLVPNTVEDAATHAANSTAKSRNQFRLFAVCLLGRAGDFDHGSELTRVTNF